MSFDLLLNDSGDLEFIDNDFVVVSTIEDSFKQRVGIRLRTNRGEWKFNTTYGVPYTNEIIGQKISKREVDAILQAEALRESGVDLITNFKSAIDVFARSYSAEFDLTTPTGPLTVVIPSQVSDPYTYPIGTDPELTVTCDLIGLIGEANNLYELLNLDLPFTGESTWYDVTQFLIDAPLMYNTINFEITEGSPLAWQALDIINKLSDEGVPPFLQPEYLAALEALVNGLEFDLSNLPLSQDLTLNGVTYETQGEYLQALADLLNT